MGIHINYCIICIKAYVNMATRKKKVILYSGTNIRLYEIVQENMVKKK